MRAETIASFLLPVIVLAQTYTDCNPTTDSDCPSDTGLDSSTYSVDFTQGSSDDWTVTYGEVTYDSDNGATFTITKSGDAPTIETNFYIFFGVISIIMKACAGTGLVSSAILQSDDLDEIDWEWLGVNADQVETNYFGKGNTTSYDRATYIDMGDAQTEEHNYTIVWTQKSTVWYVDGEAKRTLNYADAVDGTNYPQTPMRVRLGNWAGGDTANNDEGTVEWAGGETDFDQGPFIMYVSKVEITNYNPVSTYTYGDNSGSYSSILLNSASAKSTNDTASVSISDSSAVSNSTSSAGNATSSSTGSLTSSSSSSSSRVVTSSAPALDSASRLAVMAVAAAVYAFM
ncbi:concanavalin A-like lectin/glucanase domain-containing protein, partial [Xylariomycetidae sp. FL2044]